MKPNESILMFRDRVIQIYKMYEKIFLAMGKFITSLYMLLAINGTIGYAPVFSKSYVIGALACVCAILPVQFMLPIAMIVIVGNMMSLNLYMGGVVLISFIGIYVFFIRLYPKESLLMIVTILAFKMHFHYALPLIAALFGGIPCIVAILIGTVGVFSIQSIEPIVQAALQAKESVALLTEGINVFTTQVIYNPTMLATMSVLLVVFCVVYITRKQRIDYAPYVGIMIGGAMNILGFIMAILFLNISVNVLLLIVMSIISIILACIIQFMAKTLDYSRSETVQFEDEDNYYFVKVVPKIKTKKNYNKIEKVYTAHKQSEVVEIEE